MGPEEVDLQFANLAGREAPEEYNFSHFRTRHFLNDMRGTAEGRGIPPGEMAPDFRLPAVGGGWIRLSELRPKPVLLRFGSFT